MRSWMTVALAGWILVGCSPQRVESSRSQSAPSDAAAETLASAAMQRGRRFGTYFVAPDQDPGFKAAVKQFNLYTLPVLFDLVWRDEGWPADHDGSLNFAVPDQVADSAPEGTTFLIFTPIWCEQLPGWLKNGDYSAAEIDGFLNDYLTKTIDHYQRKLSGKIAAWEIVNEPTSYPRDSDKCLWHRIGLSDPEPDGYKYIRTAFHKARELLPEGTLYINNFGAEDLGPRSQGMYDLVSDLVSQGVPIDGVGLQSHFMLQPSQLPPSGRPFPEVPASAAILQNLNRLGALGLETMITEADISVQNQDFIRQPSLDLQRQAAGFREILRACLDASSCKAFTVLGVGDKDSWIREAFPEWGHALLFDENYAAKPAYSAVKAELQEDAAD